MVLPSGWKVSAGIYIFAGSKKYLVFEASTKTTQFSRLIFVSRFRFLYI